MAEHIGGHTIYAWAGLRVGDEQLDVAVIVDRITNHQPAALRRWRSVLVLIIDDASIVSAEVLNLLEQLARQLRRREAFFGGILF